MYLSTLQDSIANRLITSTETACVALPNVHQVAFNDWVPAWQQMFCVFVVRSSC